MRLSILLDSLGYDIEPEYSVPDGGRMDIFLPQRRVVFETKRPDAAHPESVRDTGSWRDPVPAVPPLRLGGVGTRARPPGP